MPDADMAFFIDGADLRELGVNMRRAARRFVEEMQPTVTEIAVEVRDKAEGIVSQYSKSIPPTLEVREMPGAAAVRAGEPGHPLALLFEIGNKGARITSPTFRHPLFGNRNHWYEQTKHRFLGPALAIDRHLTTRRMERAWEKAMAVAGLKVIWGEGQGPTDETTP